MCDGNENGSLKVVMHILVFFIYIIVNPEIGSVLQVINAVQCTHM